MLSVSRFDYAPDEDLEYFASKMREIGADVFCLQESHWSPDAPSLGVRLAGKLGLRHVFEVPNHPSHIQEGMMISSVILSRYPLEGQRVVKLPYPEFEMFFDDGRPAAHYEKNLQLASVNGIRVGNIHTQALGLFRLEYAEGKGASYARQLEAALLDSVDDVDILAGDFNMRNAPSILDRFLRERQLTDALPAAMPTRPKGDHIDYLFHGPRLEKGAFGVQEAETDHYLCWADFILIDS